NREIHGERGVGQIPAARDLLLEVLRRRLRKRRNDAEPPGVRDGRRELGPSDPLHPALHDWVADGEHFGDAGFQALPPSRREWRARSFCRNRAEWEMGWAMAGAFEALSRAASPVLACASHAPVNKPMRPSSPRRNRAITGLTRAAVHGDACRVGAAVNMRT